MVCGSSECQRKRFILPESCNLKTIRHTMPLMLWLTPFLTLPQSALRLPSLFTDHMVLQRGKAINIWGWDKPGQVERIEINGKKVTTTTDGNGRFQSTIPAMKEGGPYTLTVAGSGTKSIQDVYVGEVWICSGQSNMEWVVINTKDRALAQQEADHHIRMFTVIKNVSNSKLNDVTGSWVTAQPGTVDMFSAVGYAFAKKLYRDLHVPIGMIHTSWGGTVAEAWTGMDMLATDPWTKNIYDHAKTSLAGAENGMSQYIAAMRIWQAKGVPDFFGPRPMTEAKPDYDDSGWETTTMPYAFPDSFDGTIWFRKEVTLTAAQAASINSLSLGPIDDMDMTFINGVEVGRTDMTVPNFYSVPRRYTLRSGVLHEGRNLIAVRAYDGQGPGGFTGPKESLRLGDIPIVDGWKMKVEGPKQAPLADAGPEPQAPQTTSDPNFPSNLYNAMLYPLAPYSLRGAIWYQGESNAGRAVQYRSLLPDMIKDWRQIFRQGDFPFYTVQLANFMAPNPNQFDSQWAELRDAQDFVGQMKNGGTATILDIGEANDIHPRNKRDVGERLARIALKKDYGQNVEWQGPRFASMKIVGPQVIVTLSHANGLKTTDGTPPRAFAICGADLKWAWANAAIVGSTVVLTSTSVPAPVDVRYGWQDNPPVNLVNSDGLPAMPFRTDKHPLTTRDAR